MPNGQRARRRNHRCGMDSVRGQTPTERAAASGACPHSTACSTNRSRPNVVRRALLWMFIRGRLVAERTALINQLRALLLERGITAPQGRRKVERLLPEILADEGNGLGPRLRRLLADMREEWRDIDRRILEFDQELLERARATETTRRLMGIPGVGLLTATALVAAVGNCPHVHPWPRPRGVAGIGTAPGNDRWKTEAARHQQTRQRISADAVDPWGTHRPARARQERDPARALAQRSARADTPQRRDRGIGK